MSYYNNNTDVVKRQPPMYQEQEMAAFPPVGAPNQGPLECPTAPLPTSDISPNSPNIPAGIDSNCIDLELPTYADATNYENFTQDSGMTSQRIDTNIPLASQDVQQQLPSGWVAYLDPEGTPYYFNTCTTQSQWDRPTSPADTNFAGIEDTIVPMPGSTEESLHNVETQYELFCRAIDSSRQAPAGQLYGANGILSRALNPKTINPEALYRAPIIHEDFKKFHSHNNCCKTLCLQWPWLILNAIFIGAVVAIIVVGALKVKTGTNGFEVVFYIVGPIAVIAFIYYVLNICKLCSVTRNNRVNQNESTVSNVGGHSFHVAKYLLQRSGESSVNKSLPEAIQYYDKAQKFHPTLCVAVECSHRETRTSGSGKNRRRSSHKVVTFRNRYYFPILGWRDVSEKTSTLAEEMKRIRYSNLAVNWNHYFIVPPEQMELVLHAKTEAYRQNYWRDSTCIVHVVYGLQTASGEELDYHPVDLVVTRSEHSGCCSTYTIRILVVLFTLLGMYWIPALFFALVFKIITVHDIKFIHVGYPMELLKSIVQPPAQNNGGQVVAFQPQHQQPQYPQYPQQQQPMAGNDDENDASAPPLEASAQ